MRGKNEDAAAVGGSYNFQIILSKLKTKWRLFKQSILYLPIVFAFGAVILFLLTSRLDELYYQKITLDIPYLGSLIFAGSSDAARSVLSTIAAGWATILGVAFSVTLIMLQLSITKYTSNLVNRFEGDKINQFTLGWFIAVVTYSLLVLKTIRFPDANTVEGFFTPIIGVNMAIVMAILSLFIFVLFLKNISSYLRPNVLVANLTHQILSYLRKYQVRIPYRRALSMNKPPGAKILEVRSRNDGVLNNVDWKAFSKGLADLDLHFGHEARDDDDSEDIKKESNYYNHTNNLNSIGHDEGNNIQRDRIGLWVDLTKSIGESIRKSEVIAIVYRESGRTESTSNQNQGLISVNDNDNDFSNSTRKIIKKCEDKVLSSIEVTQDRSYDNDPLFGIELLRSLAVKSLAVHDTDVAKSTVTGLFKILIYALQNEDIFGIPFYVENQYKKIQNHTSLTQKSMNSVERRSCIVINPKEISLANVVKNELSVICDLAVRGNHLPIITHFINEYICLGYAILDLVPPKSSEVFTVTANWFSQLLLNADFDFPDQLKKQIRDPLVKFDQDLSSSSPQASRILDIYFKKIIDELSSQTK